MVAEGYKDTEIGVIPIEWDVKKLDDISELTSSKRVHLSDYVDVGIPFYRGKEITLLKKNKIVDDLLYISEEQYNKIKNQFGIPMRNDILITAVGTLANTYRIPNDNPFYFKDGNLIWLKDISENSIFIDYMLGFHKKQILDSAIGSSQKALTIKELKRIKIPLPPLKEQEKIADILSTADEKIDAIALQIQKAETLKKGLLQKLLSEGIGHSEFKDSELGKIPEGWEVVKLNDLGKITMGQSPKSDTYNTDKIGMPLIQGNADCKNRKTIPRTYTTDLTKECFIGDIIMTVRAPVGAISKSLHNACIGRGVCSIKPKEDNEYIYHCLVAYEDNWDKLSQGSTFTAVSGSDIKNLKFPLPPLEEQKQIAEILSTADEKLEVLKAKKEKYETLKKGLLQKLLSGEVRV